MVIHTIFDLLAAATSIALTLLVYKRWLQQDRPLAVQTAGPGYAIALVIGAIVGGYGLGTLNLWLSDIPSIGRSILGALAGAIAAVELFKWTRNITGSTGLIFVPAFAVTVAVGRWGCFLSALEDQTHGVATTLPWAYDFGDGILRHPVQLYEAAAMTVFLFFALMMFAKRQRFFMANGFYLLVLWYSAQRFMWEFYKPYAAVVGPFNIFHLTCLVLVGYAGFMIQRGSRGLATA